MSAIGQAVRAARQHYGLSQGDLAKRSGMARQNICRLERGERSLTIRGLECIAKGFGIEAWRLLRYAHKIETNLVTVSAENTCTENSAMTHSHL